MARVLLETEGSFVLRRMDVTAIRQACLTIAHGITGLRSLQFQNHLYGCFILMEDIAQGTAQGTAELTGTVFRMPTFSFDLEKRFDEIGLHYGFLMDTQLRWPGSGPETDTYRRCWIEAFQATAREKKMETVDHMEDVLIEFVTQHIPAQESFFSHALHTGVLPHDWIDRALALLSPSSASSIATASPVAPSAVAPSCAAPSAVAPSAVAPSAVAPSAVAPSASDSESEESSTVWNHAQIEKTSLKRRLRLTRRARPMVPKKHLGATRRHH